MFCFVDRTKKVTVRNCTDLPEIAGSVVAAEPSRPASLAIVFTFNGNLFLGGNLHFKFAYFVCVRIWRACMYVCVVPHVCPAHGSQKGG